MQMLDGNQALLKKLLLQFAEQFADTAGQVATLIEQGNRQDAADTLHRIKGAAALVPKMGDRYELWAEKAVAKGKALLS